MTETTATEQNCYHTKDAMNPRSSTQSPEGDSRRFLSASAVLMGWTRAREGYVYAEVSAIRR